MISRIVVSVLEDSLVFRLVSVNEVLTFSDVFCPNVVPVFCDAPSWILTDFFSSLRACVNDATCAGPHLRNRDLYAFGYVSACRHPFDGVALCLHFSRAANLFPLHYPLQCAVSFFGDLDHTLHRAYFDIVTSSDPPASPFAPSALSPSTQHCECLFLSGYCGGIWCWAWVLALLDALARMQRDRQRNTLSTSSLHPASGDWQHSRRTNRLPLCFASESLRFWSWPYRRTGLLLMSFGQQGDQVDTISGYGGHVIIETTLNKSSLLKCRSFLSRECQSRI